MKKRTKSGLQGLFLAGALALVGCDAEPLESTRLPTKRGMVSSSLITYENRREIVDFNGVGVYTYTDNNGDNIVDEVGIIAAHPFPCVFCQYKGIPTEREIIETKKRFETQRGGI